MIAIAAAFWLIGLFAAAPILRGREPYDIAGRIRDALILGVAIPFALGLFHLLYPAACWIVLGLCIAGAYRRGAIFDAGGTASAAPPYLLIVTLAAVAWPQFVRPLLDGDSLSYHLPNAASWVQAHSLWSTATLYWWYPPASELFASGLYATGGPFAMPWCGLGALALLGLRIAGWAREGFGASPLLADALAAATVSAYPLAIQGGTLQNDVWLAAFWIESLWTLRNASTSGAAIRTIVTTALIKPQGWLFALIALIASRAKVRFWLAALAALALWLLRDAILLRSAPISPVASSAFNDPLGSTILAHGLPALWMLITVTLRISPFALLALAVALFAPTFSRDRRLAWGAFAAAAVFFVLPFGYATSVAQLAGGASLRFAAPAIAAGALVLAGPARRIGMVAAALLTASAVYGIYYVLAIFWNDGSTHVALAIAPIAVAVAAIARRGRVWWPNALAFGLAVVVAAHLAARHPLDYYNDALTVGGKQPGVYRWIAQNQPARIGGDGVRLGVVNVLSPTTFTSDLLDPSACAQARRTDVILVAVRQSDLPEDANLNRMLAARACGSVLYADSNAIAAWPRGAIGH